MAKGILKSLNTDGSVNVLVRIPQTLWAVLDAVGKQSATALGLIRSDTDTHDVGFRLLVERLDKQAQAGSLRFLPGDEWQLALDGKASSDRQLPKDFDRTVLHQSSDRKSGYMGVFTYGSGFKIRVRHPSGLGAELDLGQSYKTAELAALARYYYYLKHQTLAYGVAEEEIVAFRKFVDPNTINIPDVDLWPEVVEHLRITGRYEQVFAAGQVNLVPGPREPQLPNIGKPAVDDSHWKSIRARVSNQDVDVVVDKEPIVESPEELTSWKPTWSNLLQGQQQTESQQPAKRGRGRPRVHYLQDSGECACGKQWPCPRRDKSLDG